MTELTDLVPTSTQGPFVALGDPAYYGHSAHHRALGTAVETLEQTHQTVINAKAQYGAIGNGVADDQTAIQNALTACGAAGGGVVYLPPGTYLVGIGATGTLLSIPSKVTLRGVGMLATILKSGSTQNGHQFCAFATSSTGSRIEHLGTTATTATTSSASFGGHTLTDCHVVDCWVDAKWGWSVFWGTNSKYCRVDRCVLPGTFGSHNVEINQSSYCVVEGSHMTHSGLAGSNCVEIYDNTTYRCVGNQVTNNTMIGGAAVGNGSGILTAGDIGSIITGNVIVDMPSYGIYVEWSGVDTARKCRDAVISGNVIKGCDTANGGATAALAVGVGAQKCSVVGNVVEGSLNATTGIRVDGINNTVTGNVASQNGGSGFHIVAARCVVMGNTSTDNSGTGVGARHGIVIEGDNCTVIGNLASDTRGGSARQYIGTFINASNCTVLGNRGSGNLNQTTYDAGTNNTLLGNDHTVIPVTTRFPAGNTALFGGTPVTQPTRAGQLADNSGGTSGGSTIAAVTNNATTADAIATLAARLNLLEGKISAAGTGIGVTA